MVVSHRSERFVESKGVDLEHKWVNGKDEDSRVVEKRSVIDRLILIDQTVLY